MPPGGIVKRSWRNIPFFYSGTRAASPVIPLGVVVAVVLFALLSVRSPEGLCGPDILSAVYPVTISLLFRAHHAPSRLGLQNPALLRRVKSRSSDDFIPVADDDVLSDRSVRENTLESLMGQEKASVGLRASGMTYLCSTLWSMSLSTPPPLILRI